MKDLASPPLRLAAASPAPWRGGREARGSAAMFPRRRLGQLVVAGSAATIAGACAVTEPSPSPRSIPHTDVNPWGVNMFLHKEVERWKKEQSLMMIQEAGIGWIKQQFPWEEIEQPRKGQYWDTKYGQSTWDKFDEIVDLAEEHGLGVIARLDRPPAWARSDKAQHKRPPDNFDDYGDFVHTVVSRYRERVEHFQIWNEPNLGSEWTGRVEPDGYAQLLRIAYTRAKEANPQAVVMCAPLAINMEQGPVNLNELDYLDRLYLAGAQPHFDVMLANAYGMDRPPTDPPSPTELNFQRVALLREVMVRYGDADKAVWFNEYGWNASPQDLPPDKLIWRRVTDRQQADWTVQGVLQARRTWPWVGAVMVWYFRQVGDTPPSESEYYFRMVEPDFTPRPVYFAVKQAATARLGW